jgi:hypothetical protein
MPNNVADLELDDKRLSAELKDSPYAFEGRLTEAEDPIIQTMVEGALAAARAGRKGLTQSIKNAVNQKIIDGDIIHLYHESFHNWRKDLYDYNLRLLQTRKGIIKRNISREWGVL